MDPTLSSRPSLFQAILGGRCPECRIGKVSDGYFGMKKRCPHCGHDIEQENGYFLGAMMVAFFATAALTIPPVLILKFMGFDDSIVLTYPFLQYLVLGPLLTYYAKIAWVHAGYYAKHRMEKPSARTREKK